MIIQQVDIPFSHDIPNVDQFFGLWSVMPDRMCQLLFSLQFYDFQSHIQNFRQQQAVLQQQGESDEGFQLLPGGIARIDLNGMLTKKGNSLSQQGSTIRARRAIRNAANNPNIGGILLLIESAGGTVQGTKEAADDVYFARSLKPVVTYYEDTGGSAAFFIGSQATESYANEPSILGSIGTLLTLVDSSVAASKSGLKVHVLSTGEFKGAGVPGSQITSNQLEMFRGLVQDGNELFLDGVSRGRDMPMSRVRQLATGEIFLAAKAAENGLIDGVARYEDAVERLRFLIGGNTMTLSNNGQVSMPPFTAQQQGIPNQHPVAHGAPASLASQSLPAASAIYPATQQPQPGVQLSPAQSALQQLRQACPGAPPEFILDQLASGASPTSAQAAYIGFQQRQLAELQQQVQGLTGTAQQPFTPPPQQVATPQLSAPVATLPQPAAPEGFFLGGQQQPAFGNDPIMAAAQGPHQYGDPISQWEMEIAKNESAGMNRREATLRADGDNPGLRQQMLAQKQQLSMASR